MSATVYPDGGSAPEPAGKAELLRAAVARDYERLCRYLRPVVRKTTRLTAFHDVQERSQEVVAEAVRRALDRADQYDPRRAPLPWLCKFATTVLQESVRQDRREQPVKQTDLGATNWAAALETLIGPGNDEESQREWVRRALARLRESDRRLLESKYRDGLDGPALAGEVGAPSASAARTALHRALQALRVLLTQGEGPGHRGGEESQSP